MLQLLPRSGRRAPRQFVRGLAQPIPSQIPSSALRINKAAHFPDQAVPEVGHHAQNPLDSFILSAFHRYQSSDLVSLPSLLKQYEESNGRVLDGVLPYESTPSPGRRVRFNHEDNRVVLVAHVLCDGKEHTVSVCSGFCIDVRWNNDSIGGQIIATCAHTLEQIKYHQLLKTSRTTTKSTTVILSSSPGAREPHVHHVSSILSALPRSDVLLMSLRPSSHIIKTFPINPYPAPINTYTRAHFLSTDARYGEEAWDPWDEKGFSWKKWARGRVTGYRDSAGREAEPGTYDSLLHLLFDPIPVPGSSGAPIVDEENGAVIGIVTGSGMYDGVSRGVSGRGTPAEALFELFSLPGFKPTSKN